MSSSLIKDLFRKHLEFYFGIIAEIDPQGFVFKTKENDFENVWKAVTSYAGEGEEKIVVTFRDYGSCYSTAGVNALIFSLLGEGDLGGARLKITYDADVVVSIW